MRFASFTREDQLQHLFNLAHAALQAWHIEPHTVTLVQYENNAVYRVSGAEGEYALRINRPAHKPLQWIESELMWLHTLHTIPMLHVPRPMRDVYRGQLTGVDGEVYAVLFEWLEGDALPPAEHTPSHLYAVGQHAAHLHATPFERPATFDRPILDHEGLFGERSAYHPREHAHLISPFAQSVLSAVAEQVGQVMDALAQHADQMGMIHGDMIFKNILFHHEQVRLIDFDDCGTGYYLYELACPLLFYRHLPNYADLKTALLEGYTHIRPLPPAYRDALETFIAARYVASCRWVASNAAHPSLRGRASQIIDERAHELERYLQSGRL